MPRNGQTVPTTPSQLQIEDFSLLLSRYQSQNLARRATMVLLDAKPALLVTQKVVDALAANKHLAQALKNIRGNSALIAKIRPSEARNALLDADNDFIKATRNKFAAWSKTLERLSQGEGIEKENGREFIPCSTPVASAVMGNACISNYLAMMQLVLSELVKIDSANAELYAPLVAENRRCATILSDYENASAIASSIH